MAITMAKAPTHGPVEANMLVDTRTTSSMVKELVRGPMETSTSANGSTARYMVKAPLHRSMGVSTAANGRMTANGQEKNTTRTVMSLPLGHRVLRSPSTNVNHFDKAKKFTVLVECLQ